MTGDLGDTWAKQGKFVNLFDMFAKETEIKKEDFLDTIWYKQSPDNAWGISTAGETFGLFYRKDILEKAGVSALRRKLKMHGHGINSSKQPRN